MMKKLLLLLFIVPSMAFSQVIVNGIDLNKETDSFELWCFKKSFSTKESFYANYGQEKFKPHYYDQKTQCVNNAEGKKFEKGQFFQINKYLLSQGWIKSDERFESIGDNQGRVVTYIKE